MYLIVAPGYPKVKYRKSDHKLYIVYIECVCVHAFILLWARFAGTPIPNNKYLISAKT